MQEAGAMEGPRGLAISSPLAFVFPLGKKQLTEIKVGKV